MREEIVRVIDAAGLYDAGISPRELANQILALIKEAGYVKLAEDQSLPLIGYNPILTMSEPYNRGNEQGFKCGVIDTFDGMFKAGWRKVELG